MLTPNLAKRFSLLSAICLFLCCLMLSACGGSQPEQKAELTPSPSPSATKSAVDCASVTDETIVRTIHDKIKADEQFNGKWNQINVSCENKEVTLNGWLPSEGLVTKLEQYSKETDCVTNVNNEVSTQRTVGCGPGLIACGGTCIAENTTCNRIR